MMRRFGYVGSDSTDSEASDEDNGCNFKRSKRSRNSHSVDVPDNPKQPNPALVRSFSSEGKDLNGRNGNFSSHRQVISFGEAAKSPEYSKSNVSEIKLESAGSRRSVIVNGKASTSMLNVTDLSSPTEIMQKLGFDKTKGLGKTMVEQEIPSSVLNEIDAALRDANITIDPDIDLNEEINVEEEVKWIPPTLPNHPTDLETLCKWRKIGPRKTTVYEETEFIDPEALRNVLNLKKCFGVLDEHEYQLIRARCNPFETVGKGPFVSRAGMKMANLDAVLSNALTQPTTNSADKQSAVGPNELFYFADICAGPGGFSEYILFRKKWCAKGFGMTLKVPNLDFDVWSFFNGSPESFEPIYGPGEDGNIYNPQNTKALIEYIMASTDGRGVHLMMADGGFDIENKELQEVHSAQIYLSQCYVALSAVRSGGSFVCKFFDTLTPFTIGLIYLMYLSFDLVSIHKPNASRPANSERYLICKWKKDDVRGITSYLQTCYGLFWRWTCQGDLSDHPDLLELVPQLVLKENKEFYNYILRANTLIARSQVTCLKKMVVFCRDVKMKDLRQEVVRRKCFNYWKVPDVPRENKICLSGADKIANTLINKHNTIEFLGCQQYDLNEHNLEAFVRSPFDWRIVVIGSNQQDKNQGFYLSLGRNRVYRYDGKSWILTQQALELCKDTLVYGEFVNEIYGTKPNQAIVRTFHIIDAMVLGGTDIRQLHYTARHEFCIKFARSMCKPSRTDLCIVRAKTPVRLENIGDIFDKLENRIVANCGPSAQLLCPVDHTDETLPFIRPAGVLFLKITRDPWIMALSSRSNRKYYFNLTTGSSSYEIIPDAISFFEYTMQHRVTWWWSKELKTIMSTQDVTDKAKPITFSEPGLLNPHTLLSFVGGAWQANRNSVMRRLSSSSSSHGSC